MVNHPAEWAWSSYPGYAERSKRLGWVDHDELLRAWSGEYGGSDPSASYRAFVEAGIADPPSSPFREAFGGWVLGSETFVERLRVLAGPPGAEPDAPEARQLAGLSVERICAGVAAHYGLDPSDLARRSSIEARSTAAWLCRRYTEASLRELAEPFGLTRAGSVSNLTRRAVAALAENPSLAAEFAEIVRKLAGRTDMHGRTIGAGQKTKN